MGAEDRIMNQHGMRVGFLYSATYTDADNGEDMMTTDKKPGDFAFLLTGRPHTRRSRRKSDPRSRCHRGEPRAPQVPGRLHRLREETDLPARTSRPRTSSGRSLPITGTPCS